MQIQENHLPTLHITFQLQSHLYERLIHNLTVFYDWIPVPFTDSMVVYEDRSGSVRRWMMSLLNLQSMNDFTGACYDISSVDMSTYSTGRRHNNAQTQTITFPRCAER